LKEINPPKIVPKNWNPHELKSRIKPRKKILKKNPTKPFSIKNQSMYKV